MPRGTGLGKLCFMWLMSVLAFGACGGGEGTGTVRGQSSFNVYAALASTDPQGSTPTMGFAITDTATTCAGAKARGSVLFTNRALTGVVASTDPISPGAYPIGTLGVGPTGLHATAGGMKLKTPDQTLDATSGQITLTRVDDGGVAGSFSADIPGAGSLSGSFEAVRCDGLL